MVTPPDSPRAKGAAAFPAARRRFGRLVLAVLALALGTMAGATAAHAEIVLTDAAGREVRLDAPATRIVTNESLLVLPLALIDPDPVGRIAGWAAPRRIDRGMYAAFRRTFPAIDGIPDVGAVVPSKASAESILSVRPDLFVVSLWQPGWEDTIETLAAAGVPTVFLDAPVTDGRDPGEATARSVEILGKATGRVAQGEAFAEFVRARYRRVAARLEGVAERPGVLFDAHAGAACCNVPGRGNPITAYVELAGGRSIGSDAVAGYDGRIGPEYVLGVDPDIYVGTGGPDPAVHEGLVVGGGVDAATARASLRAVTGRNHLDGLTAVRQGRAYAVSHQLAISALNVLVLECLARWTHPALFADLDPADTLAEINRDFMAVPLEGTFWIGLKDEADGGGR